MYTLSLKRSNNGSFPRTLTLRKAGSEKAKVLCVDLDKTLTQKDVFRTALLIWFWKGFNPFHGLPPLNRNDFKDWVYRSIDLKTIDWRFNQEVINLIVKAKKDSVEIILVTGNTRVAADFFTEKLELFDLALASTSHKTLKGENKATALLSIYGENNFDYVGDSSSDLKVWAVANHAYVLKTRSLRFKGIIHCLSNKQIPFTVLNRGEVTFHQENH